MARLRAGDCRYIGTIFRPSKAPADGGRERQPEAVVRNWMFALVSSSGREMDVARQTVPLVTHALKGWHPGIEVQSQDYVAWEGKRLNIEFQDPNLENGRVLMLVCVEQQ